MARPIRQGVAPLYLLLCIVLGGSAQGIWANMVLQLLGVAILVLAAASPSSEALKPAGRHLLLLALVAVALIALQMLPLPPILWTHLGGRQIIVDGNAVLGLGAPWFPLSLAPYRTFDSLLGLIPALALFCAIAVLGSYRRSWLVAALVGGTIAGIVLGALQVSAAGGQATSWYPYAQSSFGIATGFFANGNHMATLLVATIPFLAALVRSAQGSNRQRNVMVMLVTAAAAILIFVGILLNRSLAAYGLAPPVLAASALILFVKHGNSTRVAAAAAALLALGAAILLVATILRGGTFDADAGISVESRQEMLATTTEAVRDYMPWGSGLGTFRSIYQLYEHPAGVTSTYVSHAHNDFVELALETGLPGVLLLLMFLGWWGRASWRAWSGVETDAYSRAATIASAAILVHSLVDFPLRTATIAAVFAVCLAFLVERPPLSRRTGTDWRSARHIVIK